MERLVSLLGLLALVALGYLLSTRRRRIPWRAVAIGVGLQLALGIVLLRFEATAGPFAWLAGKVARFLSLSDVGARFVFGEFADTTRFGFVFAVKVVPTIIFFSACIAVLYYLGVVQRVVAGIAWSMRKTMGTSGAETLAVAGNIFVGLSEAPLLIRPYLERLTRSELFAVMVGGFATIAGGVMAAYIGMGIAAHHLIAASLMSAPAALVMAKLMLPEEEHAQTAGDVSLPEIDIGANIVDAAARGTTDGLKLAVNVVAMLIAFLSLIAAADWLLGGLDRLVDGRWLGGEPFAVGDREEFAGVVPGSLRLVFGRLFAPLALLLGVGWRDAGTVGGLLGLKICANEFVAYVDLAQLMRSGAISERTAVISTYALCGFANFGSVGIQIGGIGAIAPSRRSELARLGVRAMFAGAFASWMTACVAGILL